MSSNPNPFEFGFDTDVFGFDPDEIEELRRQYFEKLERTFNVNTQHRKVRDVKGSWTITIPREHGDGCNIKDGDDVTFIPDPILGVLHIDMNGTLKERDE